MKHQQTHPILAALAAIALIGSSSSDAANIAFVNEVGTPDQGFVDLLTGAGHTVTRRTGADYFSLNATSAADLNAFDLVILSRTSNSGNYNNQTYDDLVTKPLIQMSAYLARDNRWGWVTGDGLKQEGVPLNMIATSASHPIFDGIAVDAGDDSTATFYTELDRGVVLNTPPNPLDGYLNNGQMIATDEAGNLAVAYWETGEVAVGPRMLFNAGTREPDGGTTIDSGQFNLSPTGETAYLNAVDFMAVPEPAAAVLVLLGMIPLVGRRRN